ncbi:MAG: hypothetical protein JEY94_10425 [Melioribacteraceae bacterium]|nr:hypothetical protein [Melioribacteraceae bacterium]
MKIEISVGELVDKVTILKIKLERIKNEDKLKNVQKEFDVLSKSLSETVITEESGEYKELKKINETLWEIEDEIRIKEQKQEFDEEFIKLARSVYFENDVRAEIKKRINILTGSDLHEEKEYVDYKVK